MYNYPWRRNKSNQTVVHEPHAAVFELRVQHTEKILINSFL
jgi:hypothetical protein